MTFILRLFVPLSRGVVWRPFPFASFRTLQPAHAQSSHATCTYRVLSTILSHPRARGPEKFCATLRCPLHGMHCACAESMLTSFRFGNVETPPNSRNPEPCQADRIEHEHEKYSNAFSIVWCRGCRVPPVVCAHVQISMNHSADCCRGHVLGTVICTMHEGMFVIQDSALASIHEYV